jgi:predicted alpha/beta hydrolase family esterase
VIQPANSPHPTHFLIQPGWQNSGPHHWQTLWQERLGSATTRVEQQDWMVPEREAWVPTLVAAIRGSQSPPVVLAHSIGSIATVFAMAAAPVAAAVLVASADAEREGAPEALRSFIPIPREPLRAPALVIVSDNDPYCSLERAREFADAWKADFEIVPGGGHINTDAGFGPWPEGWQMVGGWLRRHGLSWPEHSRERGDGRHA